MADERVQAECQAFQAQWHWPAGAKLARPGQFHITLQFLGEVDSDVEARLSDELRRIRMPELQLDLRAVGAFDRGIVYLAPDDNLTLRTLRDAVGDAVAHVGLMPDRRAWHPHVTLARHAKEALPPQQAASIRWAPRRFDLVWSRPGGEYSSLAQFD